MISIQQERERGDENHRKKLKGMMSLREERESYDELTGRKREKDEFTGRKRRNDEFKGTVTRNFLTAGMHEFFMNYFPPGPIRTILTFFENS